MSTPVTYRKFLIICYDEVQYFSQTAWSFELDTALPLPPSMTETLGLAAQLYFQVTYIRHSLVTCNTLRPQTEPMTFVNMEIILSSEYLQFWEYHLVVVMKGGNDISAGTDVEELSVELF